MRNTKAASRWSASSLGCIVSGLGFHAAVLLALLALWILIGLPYGAYRLRAAQRGWSETFLSPDQFRARYPDRPHSASALRLDGLARGLGTFLATRPGDYQPGASHADTPSLKQLREFVSSVRKQGSDARLRVSPPVAAFANGHARELQETEDVLLDGSPLDWKTGADGEFPVGLLGYRNVQEVLLVRSLVADERGDRAARDRALEASWRLEESLWRRPVLLEHFIANSVAAERNACLRRFRQVPEAWGPRLRRPERLRALVDAYQMEVLTFCRSAERLMGFADADYLTGEPLPRVTPGRWVIRVGTAPFLRMAVAGYADALRAEVQALRGLDPCTVAREPYTERAAKAQPHVNAVTQASLPSMLGAWWAARDVLLDEEMTAGVLQVRPLLGSAAAGSWRAASVTCPSFTWSSAAVRPDEVVIRPAGEHEPGVGSGTPGLSYTITAP
jgi:hypothetical protein